MILVFFDIFSSDGKPKRLFSYVRAGGKFAAGSRANRAG